QRAAHRHAALRGRIAARPASLSLVALVHLTHGAFEIVHVPVRRDRGRGGRAGGRLLQPERIHLHEIGHSSLRSPVRRAYSSSFSAPCGGSSLNSSISRSSRRAASFLASSIQSSLCA